MSAPWPDSAHVCAGSREPILDSWTHKAMRGMEGATAEEIVEEVLRFGEYAYGHPWTGYDRRMAEARVREIVAETRQTAMPTADEIRAKQAELARAGKPSGERPVADALGLSKSYVHRRLAEDAPGR